MKKYFLFFVIFHLALRCDVVFTSFTTSVISRLRDLVCCDSALFLNFPRLQICFGFASVRPKTENERIE